MSISVGMELKNLKKKTFAILTLTKILKISKLTAKMDETFAVNRSDTHVNTAS